MEEILSRMTVSISEFKDNPSKVVRQAEDAVFCVLNNNKPAFYVVTPEKWEQIMDDLEDFALMPQIIESLSNRDKAVTVALEDL